MVCRLSTAILGFSSRSRKLFERGVIVLYACAMPGVKPGPAQWQRRARAITALAFVLVSVLKASDARACGPCTTPELWDVQNLAGETVVVTNFGLLSRYEGGWRVTCEEVIGGLLLDVQGDDAESLVSTDSGLFVQAGGLCDWSSGPASVGNDWALSLSSSRVDSGEARARFALVLDAETSELHVERSVGGQDFTVIHSFASTSGYRELESGGEPAALFVAGYTYEPRTWNLAFSTDEGETWDEAAPEVDNDYATMFLRLVDPAFPRAVFLQAETVAGLGHELWRFDAETGEAESLLTLEDGELFGGIALSGDTLWVAGRHRDGGSLYRADRSELVFSRVVDSGPAFECLAAHDGTLYACVNDFTLASDFILGSSTDEGETWTALMTVSDLGKVAGCSEECAATVQWLQGTYGVPAEGGGAGSGGTSGADAGDASGGTGTTPSPRGGCQSAARQVRDPSVLGGIALLLALLTLRRRFTLQRARGMSRA